VEKRALSIQLMKKPLYQLKHVVGLFPQKDVRMIDHDR
jgi:hypothetical protein